MDFVTRAIDKVAHKLDPIFETHAVDDPTKRFGNGGRRQMTFGQLKSILDADKSRSETSSKRTRASARTSARRTQSTRIETPPSEPEIELGITIAQVNTFTL
jgi:hypothetical protein